MTKSERSAIGRAFAALRKTHGAGSGRPKVLRECLQCRAKMGARELRAHHCFKQAIKKVTYTVIVEKSKNNYGAWASDLPSCVSVGPTVDKTLANMRAAIELHLENMREDGDPIPQPSTTAAVVDITVALNPARALRGGACGVRIAAC